MVVNNKELTVAGKRYPGEAVTLGSNTVVIQSSSQPPCGAGDGEEGESQNACCTLSIHQPSSLGRVSCD
jgi:hypothetical protein